MYKEISTMEELNAFLSLEGTKLLFKHSTTCPISARAHDQFKQYLQENDDQVHAALVKVIEDRPISNHIAEKFNIKHESPQIFLLKGEQVIWHTSHYQIRKDSIEEEVNKA